VHESVTDMCDKEVVGVGLGENEEEMDIVAEVLWVRLTEDVCVAPSSVEVPEWVSVGLAVTDIDRVGVGVRAGERVTDNEKKVRVADRVGVGEDITVGVCDDDAVRVGLGVNEEEMDIVADVLWVTVTENVCVADKVVVPV
jgi:hypothetical protein